MIFVNKLRFLFMIACSVTDKIIFNHLQASTPLKIMPYLVERSNRNRSNSVNFSPVSNLQYAMLSTQNLNSPVASTIINNIGRLQESAGRSKYEALLWVADFAQSEVLNPTNKTPAQINTQHNRSPLGQNNQLLKEFQSPKGAKKSPAVRVLEQVIRNLPHEHQQEYSVVMTDHVLCPKRIIDAKTNKCIGISGGHDIDKYRPGQLQVPCILSQNKKVAGVFVSIDDNKAVCKTVEYDMNAEDIITTTKKSVIVAIHAKKNGDLTIVKSLDNFYGVYIHPKDPLIHKTQFPLMVVDHDEKDTDGNIVIATLANLQPDYQKMQDHHKLIVNPKMFQNMVQKSPALSMKSNEFFMYDITQAVQDKFKPELKKRGYHDSKLPGAVYVVKRKKA